MAYLGIDQSLRRPGFALVDQAGQVIRATAPIVAADLRGGERLHRIYMEFVMFLDTDAVPVGCIEGYSVKSVNRPFDLGEVSGVLRAAMFQKKRVELIVVPPTSLKAFATGISTATKGEMIEAALKLTGHRTLDDNEADAILLAYMARCIDRNVFPTRKAREAANHIQTTRRKSRVKSTNQYNV